MVDTKDESAPGRGRGTPEDFQEVERELRRLECERLDYYRVVKPLLHVASIALDRERRDGAAPPDGAEELAGRVSQAAAALNRRQPSVASLAELADSLASHFKITIVQPPPREAPPAPDASQGGPAGAARPPVAGGDAGTPAPARLAADQVVGAFANDQFMRFLEMAAGLRGGRYSDAVAAVRSFMRVGDVAEDDDGDFAWTLTSLLVRLASDARGERQEIAVKLSVIIRALVNLEREFRSFLDRSITQIGENEAHFNEGLSQRVEKIQEHLSVCGEGDPEGLINLISEEMELISSALHRKAEEDATRLHTLQDEKFALETSLDSVRRDYDTFMRQSRQMLKEIEEMRSIALRDGLTKVFNRRAYDEQILLTLVNYKSGKLPAFSVVIFDIDHFRDVNNNYGHQAGDRILVHLASTVGSTLRFDDFVFRYGGDEFVLILPGAGLSDGMMVAEKVRCAIENLEFVLVKGGTETLRVTVSMGVTEALPGDTPGSILSRADKALYASKQAGRNRVTTAAPDDGPLESNEGEPCGAP
jgi:diguanylate cyclase